MKSFFLLTLILAMATLCHQSNAQDARVLHAAPGTPEIDGEIDEAWEAAPKATTDRYCESESTLGEDDCAKAKIQCMWDEKNIYVLAHVTDGSICVDGVEDWQQDSVEIFLDQNMGRSDSYQEDDGQFRVNAEGTLSYGPETNSEIKAVATKTETGYLVEAAIPLSAIEGADGTKIGFDIGINDDSDESGMRSGVMKWNDETNDSWQDTSGFGTLILSSAENVKPYDGDSADAAEAADSGK